MSPIVLGPNTIKKHIPDLDSVEPCLAVGGFKAVYAVIVHGKKEALKVARISRITDASPDQELVNAFYEEQIARVQREIKALEVCRIPELVRLASIAPMEFDVGDEKYIAYSEEFLEGQDLWKLITRHDRRPPLAELGQLFRALLNCIQELWKNGFVHRDIKPANVMKTDDPARRFVLLDLGIAYAVYETGLTVNPERVLATYRYLAPEMMQPDFRDRLDFRADLYTTGMTVFEYAAGKHPLARDDDDMIRTISRALRQPPTPLKQYRPDLPDEFCSLVDGLLKKKPALRPANLAALFKKLEAIA